MLDMTNAAYISLIVAIHRSNAELSLRCEQQIAVKYITYLVLNKRKLNSKQEQSGARSHAPLDKFDFLQT